MRGLLLVMLAAAAVARAACGDGDADTQAVAEARAAVEVRCPCAAATSHIVYVHCAARVVAERAAEGLLPRACRTRVKRCAARSICGRSGAVTCCGGRRAGSGCRVAPSAANCTRRGGSPGTVASCCVACRPAPEVAFVERRCPSLWAPPACAGETARPTCHEAFSDAACSVGPDDRATFFTPEDSPADGGSSRAWSFPIRPRGRTFYGDHREVAGALRVATDGAGVAGTLAGATDEAHLRLSTAGNGCLLLSLGWFTDGLSEGTVARLRVARAADDVVDVTELPAAPVARRRNVLVTWRGQTELAVSASLTAERSATVGSAELLWQLALLDPDGDDDHDGVPNHADPEPLDRTVPGPPPPSGRPKVLVVGLDGAGWNVLEPLIDAGYLPTIGDVVHSGARASLDEPLADPPLCCFCPPVWSSIATGHQAEVHGMHLLLDEGWDRRVPAVWSVLDRYGGTSTLVLYRNTWPPEPGATYNFSEHGVVWAGGERFAIEPALNDRDDRGDTVSRLQWTWPPRLFERVGVLPHTGPLVRTWRNFAADRTGAAAVAALAAVEQTDLTMWTIHSPDKSGHLNWCSVQPTVEASLDVDALLAQAAAWTGPVQGAGWLYGTIASQNLEADFHIGTVLGVRPYDYVMLLSDHAMSHNTHPGAPFCGRHEDPPAFLGIFALAGPGVRGGADLGTLSPLDVAPTLAYLLGLPVSQALPGRVVTEAFTAEHLASHPIRTVPSW